ncbi:hypothetical protein ACLMJK_008364 [Lecanora helva]
MRRPKRSRGSRNASSISRDRLTRCQDDTDDEASQGLRSLKSILKDKLALSGIALQIVTLLKCLVCGICYEVTIRNCFPEIDFGDTIFLQRAWRRIGSMISLQWDVGVDRMLSAMPPMPDVAASDISALIHMLYVASFACAFAWISYRSWQIYMKPREELEELLGLDIPPVPEVSLAGITSDSVLLYYKPLDVHVAPLKLSVQVNGIKVGEFNRGDTSVTITGLVPGNYYSVRVLATNASNFTSLGPVIRLRTHPPDKHSSVEPGDALAQNEPAAVHATSVSFEAGLPSTLSRDYSSNQHHIKRVISGRRNSPANPIGEQSTVQSAPTDSGDDDESPESIQRLTERLNYLRAEKERVDRECAEEEEESRHNLAELTEERDRLRQEVKEREEASSELRKQSNHLDKLNRAAQNRKAATEKQLQQKKAERQKLKDDIQRWETETIEMRQDVENMKNERDNILAAKDAEVAEIRKGIADDLVAIKSLEEEIRIKGAQIRVMEREQDELSGEQTGAQGSLRSERETDQAWEARMQTLYAQAAVVWQSVQQSQVERQQAEEILAWWMARRARNPEQFAPIPSLDFTASMQQSRSRRSRQPNSRTSTISSPSTTHQSGTAAFSNVSTVSPSFSVASTFFNIGNGTAVTPMPERLGQSRTDAETLEGNGPMSPAASNLLPSNLFREDDAVSQHLPEETTLASLVDNEAPETFLGHTVTGSDASAHGLNTPGSTSSRPGSVFSSPMDNPQNSHNHHNRPDPFIDGDQHSSSSRSASLNPSIATDTNSLAAGRLANLFSSTFSRQREKPANQEPPLLGTLKQGQSQSFPRNVEQQALDSTGDRRRRGSHGNWPNPVSGLLSRNTGNSDDSGIISARTGSGRRSRLNMFTPKVEGLESGGLIDHSASSRPSSTYSFDQNISRPSSDSQRYSWLAPESGPSRSSPLSSHWLLSNGPWSHTASRRPSVQHGSTSNLSIGSTPLDPDGLPGSSSKPSSDQAPIGTRPQSSQRPMTPRLNPAAPTFKTLFTRGDTRKSAKSEKQGARSTDKLRDKDSETGETEDVESWHESSPQNPRLSRDSQSVTTAASTADSYESFDRSTSGTPSDTTAPAAPKETLMQKISRKSSSSKFNVPWAKERGLFSKRAGEPSTPSDIDVDTANESQLGKGAESSGSTPQQEKAGRSSISWPNIRRKSRKGDQALAEASERGSDIGDDEES